MKHGALSRVLHGLHLHSMPHTGFPYARRTKYPPSSGLQSVRIPSPMSPHIYSTSHGLLPCVSSFKPHFLPLPMPTPSPSPADFVFTVLTAPLNIFYSTAAVLCVSPWEKPSFFLLCLPPLGLYLACGVLGHLQVMQLVTLSVEIGA